MDPNTALQASRPDARRWLTATGAALVANLVTYAIGSARGATWAAWFLWLREREVSA